MGKKKNHSRTTGKRQSLENHWPRANHACAGTRLDKWRAAWLAPLTHERVEKKRTDSGGRKSERDRTWCERTGSKTQKNNVACHAC